MRIEDSCQRNSGRRLFSWNLYAFDTDPAQQVESLFGAVIVAVNHPSDTGLNNQFRTFDTRGGGDVERRAVAVVGRLGNLRDGVGLGVEHIGFGVALVVLADVFETRRRAVVAVRDDHLVFDDQRPDLAAHAVGVFSPDA